MIAARAVKLLPVATLVEGGHAADLALTEQQWL